MSFAEWNARTEAAIEQGVAALPGVGSVHVDLGSKRIEVTGTALDDAAIRAAITKAGYEAD